MQYFINHFQIFLLIMMRLTSMMIIAPFFSSGVIPFRIKALIAFFITLVIFPTIAKEGYVIPVDMGAYYLLVLKEVLIGLFIGFLVSLIFTAFQLAGEYYSVLVGFGISEVVDPLAQVSLPLLGQLKNLVGLILFLVINGHHFLIKAIYRSYELIPVISLGPVNKGLLNFVVYSMGGMFVIALKIALPVLATVFLVEVSLGILAKAAPQMNILMLGFPIKIAVAFGILILISPLIIRIMYVSLERTFQFISKVLLHWPT
ncbi:MAG: flagellar biosynthetic protein FliR [Spirochaetota bacterium]